MVKITVTGAGGRMGQMLLKAVLEDSQSVLHGATVRTGDARAGSDAAALIGSADTTGVTVRDSAVDVIAASDVVIDFTPPEAALEHARICANSDVFYVCGTTGFDDKAWQKLQFCAEHIPVLWAANFSLGFNMLLTLAAEAAARLPCVYDIEIWEMHHNQKRDAPSGSALALAKTCAEARDWDGDGCLLPPHHGSHSKRVPNRIGMAVSRGGTVAGTHQVMFAGDNEHISLQHRAESRKIFAQGAVHGALWLCQPRKSPGLYSMQDVLTDTDNDTKT